MQSAGCFNNAWNAVAGALVLTVSVKPLIISDAVLAWARQPRPAMQREFRSFEGRFN